MKENNIWLEIKFIIILSFICALFLGTTQIILGDKAELSERTIDSIFNILDEKHEVKTKYELFNSTFQLISTGRIKIWSHKTKKSLIACEATGSGMWSEITIVFVYDKNEKKILGLKVTEQKETAGLGSKITEEDFSNQFHNFDVSDNIKVDAISGATTSSKSVEQLLIKSINKINKCDIIQ